MSVGYWHTVMCARRIIIDGLLRLSDRNCREQDDKITADDWRGVRFAGDCDFPADVVGLAPGYRGVGRRRNTGCHWAAPLSPFGEVGVGACAQGALFIGPRGRA